MRHRDTHLLGDSAAAVTKLGFGAASLQFPFGQPAVAAVIPGMRDAGEVRQNVEWLDAPIPRALWEDLRTEGLLLEGVPMPAERLNNST